MDTEMNDECSSEMVWEDCESEEQQMCPQEKRKQLDMQSMTATVFTGVFGSDI